MNELEKALLWVIYEQCVYGEKAYAKLLIHGEDAFKALGLKDGCDVSEIENRLFQEGKHEQRNKCEHCEIPDV